MEVLNWIEDEGIFEIPEIASRNSFAEKYRYLTVDQILNDFTYINQKEWNEFVKFIIYKFNLEFKGVGVELGAGCAGFSNAVITNQNEVSKIYAVEIVPKVVSLLQSKVTNSFKNEDKLIHVIGSFDSINLPDKSVDFIIEYDSLHHSSNLEKTLKEASRILKDNGILVALDRVHHDSMLEDQRQS